MKTQILIIHNLDLCTTGKSSYFIREKMNMHTPPFTEWEHKLQQHLPQVMVHMVAIPGIKQKVEFPTSVKTQKTYCTKKVIHILCNEGRNQLSGLSSRQTPPSIATDCPATAPGGSLEMWVCGKVERVLLSEKRGKIMQDTKQASKYWTITIRTIEQRSITEVWGQNTKRVEKLKTTRILFFFALMFNTWREGPWQVCRKDKLDDPVHGKLKKGMSSMKTEENCSIPCCITLFLREIRKSLILHRKIYLTEIFDTITYLTEIS